MSRNTLFIIPIISSLYLVYYGVIVHSFTIVILGMITTSIICGISIYVISDNKPTSQTAQNTNKTN